MAEFFAGEVHYQWVGRYGTPTDGDARENLDGQRTHHAAGIAIDFRNVIFQVDRFSCLKLSAAAL